MTTTLPAFLGRARELLEPALRGAVDRLSPPIRLAAGYHLGWWDARGMPPAGRGGKAIRPALALLSAQAAGMPAERALPAAVAVELVHNFSLLHDDVMDRDRVRHGRPTAWAVFGTELAILAGDALLPLATDLLLETPSPTTAWAGRSLGAATQRLIAGQAADLAFERRADVTLDECLRMASDKTGALLGCSCAIGAVLADAPPALALGLGEFGQEVGLAFQLVDDLLGIWGDPRSTGKPVLSDLRVRKKSLPVVAALTSDSSAGAKLAELYTRAELLDEDELRRAAALVERAGGRRWAEQECARRLDHAERLLAEALPDPAAKAHLLEIARFITARDR